LFLIGQGERQKKEGKKAKDEKEQVSAGVECF